MDPKMQAGTAVQLLAPLVDGTRARDIYGTSEISERHRHRWEFNNRFRETLEKAGLVLSGLSPDRQLVEMIELQGHPFFVGCQFHPEFKSRPMAPHPLFRQFIRAALDCRRHDRPVGGTDVRLAQPLAH